VKILQLYSIRSRFLFGMTLAAILIGMLFATGFYLQMRTIIENEMRDKADLIISQVEAVQHYVRETLRPQMYVELPDKFVIEAMSSSFITRSVMEHRDIYSSQFLYRRVSKNARNPNFEANDTERRLIAYFRENPQSTIWQGHISIDRVDHFVMARPVRFEESCLRCHGDPDQAPAELLTQYGLRGFGRILNQVEGLDFVGLPASSQISGIRKHVTTLVVIFSITAVLFFLTTQIIFKHIVSDNIRQLTQLLRGNLQDAQGQQLLREVQQRDELGAMIAGVERLGNHIADNRKQLEAYAASLEDMVETRTRELARQFTERTADVNLFVNLLANINCCQSRPQLWRHSLPLIAQRFGLARAAYVCTFVSQNFFAWPDQAGKPELPDDYVEILTQPEVRLQSETAFIPVESSEGNTEGLLCLEKQPGEWFQPDDQVILRALGRQLGIAAEYLTALDNIMQHSERMQSIFEGISDPLMLADENGLVIVTNNAARKLAREISAGKREDGNILPLLSEGDQSGRTIDIKAIVNQKRVETREVKLASGRIFALGLHPLPERRVVVHASEVTDQYRMLDQVTRSEKMATVGKLAAGLAHEINNPLGVILCYAELLKKGAGIEQTNDLDIIIRHTRQAREVLRNLLNFARPKVTTDEETNLTAAAESLTRVFRVQAEKKGARIILETDSDIPALGVTPQAVEHILANLLLNALDALPPTNGEIRLSIRHDSESRQVIMTVMDNGVGLDEQDIPHLFDPFFTTKETGKGAGLGLTVVYGFMQDMGGSVEAFNRPEGGACFVLRFPLPTE
jgi:signal transduction histidine kinase